MGWHANERLSKMKFRKHNCHVLQTVPEEKRLVHQSNDGWAPICKYLDHEVPDLPYPHQNKNASLFHEQMTKSPLFRQMIREVKMLTFGLGIALVVFASWYVL